jgi:quinol monooxygenase YgiN
MVCLKLCAVSPPKYLTGFNVGIYLGLNSPDSLYEEYQMKSFLKTTCFAIALAVTPVMVLAEGPVSWDLAITVPTDKTAAFSTLMNEMVEATQANEPGAMVYQWYQGTEPASWHIIEHYSDSDATLVHLGAFGQNYAKRFLALATPSRLTVFGDPSPAVREALAGFGAVYYEMKDGFNR